MEALIATYTQICLNGMQRAWHLLASTTQHMTAITSGARQAEHVAMSKFTNGLRSTAGCSQQFKEHALCDDQDRLEGMFDYPRM